MARQMVYISKEESFEFFKTEEISLFVYADFWEMPSAMFDEVATYPPGTLTPDNYEEIVMRDYEKNYQKFDKMNKMIGIPISDIKLGFFNQEDDFVVCYDVKSYELNEQNNQNEKTSGDVSEGQ